MESYLYGDRNKGNPSTPKRAKRTMPPLKDKYPVKLRSEAKVKAMAKAMSNKIHASKEESHESHKSLK